MNRIILVSMLLVVAVVPAIAQDQDSLVMPLVVGQELYPASKTLRKMGLEVKFEQVEVDTAEVAEFHVAAQMPDSGTLVQEAEEVVLRFNCLGMLRYWDDWVVPLLGDFKNTVGFFRVTKPPEPIQVSGAEYPEELRKYTFSGQAKVEVLVDFDGSVLAAKVIESSEYEAADSAALSAAMQGQFSGAEHYEQPVRVWFPLNFSWEYAEVEPLLPSSGSSSEPIEP